MNVSPTKSPSTAKSTKAKAAALNSTFTLKDYIYQSNYYAFKDTDQEKHKIESKNNSMIVDDSNQLNVSTLFQSCLIL